LLCTWLHVHWRCMHLGHLLLCWLLVLRYWWALHWYWPLLRHHPLWHLLRHSLDQLLLWGRLLRLLRRLLLLRMLLLLLLLWLLLRLLLRLYLLLLLLLLRLHHIHNNLLDTLDQCACLVLTLQWTSAHDGQCNLGGQLTQRGFGSQR